MDPKLQAALAPQRLFITDVKGTWYAGTGNKWDKDATIGIKAGGTVTNFGKGAHCDGAKDEEVIVINHRRRACDQCPRRDGAIASDALTPAPPVQPKARTLSAGSAARECPVGA